MLNWKKQCSNIQGFNGLYEEMTSGNGLLYIIDDVQLPDTCGNAICTIEFRYYDEHHVSIRCVEAPVNYTGSCPQIGRWLSSGTADFDSFDEMKNFLLKFRTDCVSEEELISNEGPRSTGNQTESEANSPRMKYDRDSLTIPEPYKGFVKLDKDKLLLDLTSEIFGQKDVLEMIAHLVDIFLGSKGKDRPLSIFLYGPSGTGKTETAIQLVDMINRQLPREAQRYIYRDIDCTHYTHEGDISRLTGAAPGFVGHDEDGPFAVTEDNPYVIYGINEIEKAHAEIATALMEAMDTGRMATNGKTLGNGKAYYDLSNCILIFTSNISIDDKKKLGFMSSDVAAEPQKEEPENLSTPLRIIQLSNEAKEKLAEAGAFRKEVLGRMDAVLKFNKLSGEAIIQICVKCIEKLATKKSKLYITEIDTPILQEFINVVANNSSGSFGARNPKQYANSYFGDAFVRFSWDHPDYMHIKVFGTLNDIHIEEVKK